MRRLCITVLTLVSCAALTAQETVVVLGHAPYSFADVPKPFRFVFQGSLPAGGLKEAWAELPFDSITLERTSCLGTCPAYGVTFYRGKSTSANDESIDDQFGQAALTVTRVSRPNAYFRRFPDATGNFEGRVDIWTFAQTVLPDSAVGADSKGRCIPDGPHRRSGGDCDCIGAWRVEDRSRPWRR